MTTGPHHVSGWLIRHRSRPPARHRTTEHQYQHQHQHQYQHQRKHQHSEEYRP